MLKTIMKSDRQKAFYWGLLIPTILLLLFFLVTPLVMLAEVSFREVDSYLNIQETYTFQHYIEVFQSGTYVKTIGTTLGVAFITGLCCMILAYPAAYMLVNARHSGLRTFLYILLIMPLLISMVVLSFAWIVLLAQNGMINQVLVNLNIIDQPLPMLWNLTAVVIALVQVLLPFAALPIANTLGDMNPKLKSASMSLGENRWKTFIKVTLPLSIPGLISGFVIVFSLAAGSYITALLIGGRMQPLLPLTIYQQVVQISNWPFAAALSFTLLVIVAICVLFLGWLLSRWEERVYG
ncbi:ABC transporter permease [Gracilibacillus massiliensis]|uniref:ABC transporter permease n=1 Tax=Gracilibacillus massiliensis TaxID=1564956 RepID=UPI000B1A9C05|nr:ABC transporter permease [Gracilibacillus massiliensis]